MKLIVPLLTCASAFSVLNDFNAKEILGQKWIVSQAKKLDGSEEFKFDGTWKIEAPTVFNANEEGDYGLVVSSKAKHHGISYKFDQPIDVKDSNLVVQYEVKLQSGLECGGAYLKLITFDDNNEFDPVEFNDKAKYTIMFG
jgi:calnexin